MANKPAEQVTLRCPLCGGTEMRRRYGPLLECVQCSLVITDPAALKPVASVYTEEYFTERNAYVGDSAIFVQIFQRMFDRLQQWKPTGKLIDVGCGVGLLLQVAKQRGYTVSGCDIAPWAAEYARQSGLDVQTGTLEGLAYPAAAFDVATVNHTLEHIPEPLPFLGEIHRILAPSGVLVVGVPNIAGLMAQVMRERWAGLLPDQHLWHFTPKTLRAMLEKADFEVLSIDSDPYLHRHPNRVKDAALVTVSGIGSALGRSDYMTAFARKAA